MVKDSKKDPRAILQAVKKRKEDEAQPAVEARPEEMAVQHARLMEASKIGDKNVEELAEKIMSVLWDETADALDH